MMGFWVAVQSAGPYAKKSALRSRQITTPTPHHSFFASQTLSVMPNQQRQSTESTKTSITSESKTYGPS